MSMNIEDILEQLDDMLDTAWAMPLSGGKVVVDGERVRDLLDSIRANLPSEIRQARAIVKDRGDIVDTAKKEAESIIRNAEERRNQILSHEEIVVQAQEKANEAGIPVTFENYHLEETSGDFIATVYSSTFHRRMHGPHFC